MKISYGITVCNEHEEIQHLIEFIHPLLNKDDEIVVVYDNNRVTGEVLDVLEYHQEKLRAFPFDFKQNFLENKNYLGTKCTGDYIFQIDADEIPHENLIQSLSPILIENSSVDVFVLPRVNLVEGLTEEHIKKWGWRISKLESMVEEKEFDLSDPKDLAQYKVLKKYNLIIVDKIKVKFYTPIINWADQQKRVYRNTPEIQWSGHKVHGMVEGYKTIAQLPVIEEYSIYHNKTIDRQETQNDRYDKIEAGDIKVVGITRIRNEEDIIQLTLDHVSKLVDEIYVYDDCSTDNTVAICEAHPKVVKVIKGTTWKSDSDGRQAAEGTLRQKIYEECLKSNPDWVYYFDSDEFADFEGINLSDENVDSYFLRLFDYYITKDDINTPFLERKYMGPEYRDIMMLFRPTPNLVFTGRQPSNFSPRCKQAGYVKHYGKAITVEEWEKTCDYYINHRGGEKRLDFTNKWKSRKGKAIHEKSDFGYNLIQWEQRKDHNVIINNSQGQAEKI